MTSCNRCGRPLPTDPGRFCSACGTPVTEPPRDITRPVPVLAAGGNDLPPPAEPSHGDPLLLVQRGPNEGSRWKIREGETEVGRHSSSSVLLDDISVSRRHAVVRRDGARIVVEDLGSLNGTYLNGQRITAAEPLQHGDCLQIGRYKIVVCCPR